jgi:peptidoglycan/LPS O-acetylase OafA/YrhL
MVLSYDEFRETRYFRALDGLRAVSILLVLTHHSSSRSFSALNGGLGVAIFFVISGFLITTLALREEASRGSVSLRAFYVRRACRIFPLYYFTLLLYIALVIGLNHHGHRALMLTGLPYQLAYLNEFAPRLDVMPFAHSWSLGVEEKFYLLWPAIAFLLWRGRTALRVVGTAALIFVPWALDHTGILPVRVTVYGSPLYYPYSAILVGCLLALTLHQRRAYEALVRLATPWPAFALLVVAVTAHAGVAHSDLVHFLYPIAVAGAMLPMLLGHAPWVRLLATRPMVHIGIRSYGIYLIHVIVLSIVRDGVRRGLGLTLDEFGRPFGPHAWAGSLLIFALATAGSLLAANGLNLAIEQRFIRLGRRWTRAFTGAEPVAPERPGAPSA